MPHRPFTGVTLTTVGPGSAAGAGVVAAVVGVDDAFVAVLLAVEDGVFVVLVVVVGAGVGVGTGVGVGVANGAVAAKMFMEPPGLPAVRLAASLSK
jgi:hypothetical protein